MRCIHGFDHIVRQKLLTIEPIFKTKQDLGWTRYTPRLIYLLLLCYETMLLFLFGSCMTFSIAMKFEFN
ncbi:hypothetical protein HanRHA438_Chr13g0600781 [Helianthus annuus]|nr:hypothetical protein HanRHA438_Chr13g0600781 [Helianthus annuus]